MSGAGVDGQARRTPRWERHRGVAVSTLKWALTLVAAWYFLRLMRRVEWREVGDALGHLDPWHVAVLLAIVLLRQLLSAAPLSLLVPGLALRRAVANDYAGTLVAAVAPAPSDVVLRLAMFRSWGIESAPGMTGLALNSLLFYVARFSAPALGVALLVVGGQGWDATIGWAALGSGAVALAIVAALVLALRARRSAAAVGRLAGRIVGRFRRDTTAAHTWETRLVDFQRDASALFATNAVRVAATTVCLLLTEAALVVLGVYFVGVTPEQAGAVMIAAGFLCVYPLTALPLLGLGVLDAAFVTFVADRTTVAPEDLIAGLVIFRVGVQLFPMVVGTAALLYWKRRGAGRREISVIPPTH